MPSYTYSATTEQFGVATANKIIAIKVDTVTDTENWFSVLDQTTAASNGAFQLSWDDWSGRVIIGAVDNDTVVKLDCVFHDHITGVQVTVPGGDVIYDYKYGFDSDNGDYMTIPVIVMSSGDTFEFTFTALSTPLTVDVYLLDGDSASSRGYFIIDEPSGVYQFNASVSTATLDGATINSGSSAVDFDGLEHKVVLTATATMRVATIGGRYIDVDSDGNFQTYTGAILDAIYKQSGTEVRNYPIDDNEAAITDTVGGQHGTIVNHSVANWESIAYTPPSTGSIPTNGLVLHYKIDSFDANTLIDEVGTYNGAGVGTPVAISDGKFNGAIAFNGTNRVSTTYVVQDGDISVSFWMRSADFTGTTRYLLSQSPSGNITFAFGIHGDSKQLILSGFAASGILMGQALDGVWHNVIVVAANSIQTIYLDGTEIGSYAYSHVIAGGSLAVGAAGNHNTNRFIGDMDQIRIYERALTATEVTALFNET